MSAAYVQAPAGSPWADLGDGPEQSSASADSATSSGFSGTPLEDVDAILLNGDYSADDVAVLMAARGFSLLNRDDLDHLPPPDPLIEGVLPHKGLAMLAGSRGLGKSLLALAIAGAVATGQNEWHGHRVAHHGVVLYVSLEGFHGVPKRVNAWESVSGARTEGIQWFPNPIDLKRLQDARLVGFLAKSIGAVLIVVDSARASGAGAEDTKDMGAYVNGLEMVGHLSGALVLALHNTGWDGTRERGSTLLPDACDTTLILEGEPDGIRTLKHRKHRDGDMLDQPLAFTFRVVQGTGSGVLIETDGPQVLRRTREMVQEYVQAHPGESSGAIAVALGKDRANVSRELAGLATLGVLRNDGTTQRPSWVVPQEEPLV